METEFVKNENKRPAQGESRPGTTSGSGPPLAQLSLITPFSERVMKGKETSETTRYVPSLVLGSYTRDAGREIIGPVVVLKNSSFGRQITSFASLNL